MRILLVEDDEMIGEGVVDGLKAEGYAVDWVQDGNSALIALRTTPFSLVILDLGLPGKDGISVLQEVRSQRMHVPVLVTTARDTVSDRVKGLDAGADDYLAKPFGMMELISRVNALLRRASRPSQGAAEEVAEPSDLMAVGAIKLSPSARTVVANGREVNLTRKEFDLLRTLMENKGRVLTREQLLEQVWGVSFVGETRTVDMHVKTLRRKLAEAAPGSEEAVATVRGVGYRFRDPQTALNTPASE